jgi:hypothetical protein
MAASPMRMVGMLSLAGFVLQACVNAPPRNEASSVVPVQLEQRSADAASLAEHQMSAERDAEAPKAAASQPALTSELVAKLQRAKSLDEEATRLLAEAERMQQQANSYFAVGLPIGSFVEPGNATLLNEAALRRVRADQLANEALDLRRQDSDLVPNNDIAEFTRSGVGCIRIFGYCIPPLGSVAVVDAERTGGRGDVGEDGRPKPSTPHRPSTGSLPLPCVACAPAPAPDSSPASASATSFALESGKIDGLVQGSAAVSAPSSALAGESFAVYLRVSSDQLSTVMQSLKDEFQENQTVKGKQGVRLTPRMVATVSGFGFEVAPKDGQVQAMSAAEATTWSWQVQALESGLRTLTFTLSGALTIEGKEVARNFYQYQQKVQVEVSPMGFLQQYWQWLVTTLAFPIIGALWAVFHKPKDLTGKRQPSPAEKLRERHRLRKAA